MNKEPATRKSNLSDHVDRGVLNKSTGYLLRRSQLKAFQSFAKHFDVFDIKPAQFSALEVIANNPGLGQSRLAESLGLQRTNLVGMLDYFQQRELVERRPSSTDKRSHSLHLTPKGAQLLQHLYAHFHVHEAEFTSLLSDDDVKVLQKILCKLSL